MILINLPTSRHWWRRRADRSDRQAQRADEWLASSTAALFTHLNKHDRIRLSTLAHRFLGTCAIVAADDFALDQSMRQRIAVEACLPVLNIGLDAYAALRTIIVYPTAFVVADSWTDDAGIVHEWEAPLAGSASDPGPVILAWDEVLDPDPGCQVVIHECAHVLDAGNGRINGFPPISDPALRRAWPDVFGQAYDDLAGRLAQRLPMTIDAYATEDPAECFAVMCETFFVDPQRLFDSYPAVFDLLSRYFQQDVLNRGPQD